MKNVKRVYLNNKFYLFGMLWFLIGHNYDLFYIYDRELCKKCSCAIFGGHQSSWNLAKIEFRWLRKVLTSLVLLIQSPRTPREQPSWDSAVFHQESYFNINSHAGGRLLIELLLCSNLNKNQLIANLN